MQSSTHHQCFYSNKTNQKISLKRVQEVCKIHEVREVNILRPEILRNLFSNATLAYKKLKTNLVVRPEQILIATSLDLLMRLKKILGP